MTKRPSPMGATTGGFSQVPADSIRPIRGSERCASCSSCGTRLDSRTIRRSGIASWGSFWPDLFISSYADKFVCAKCTSSLSHSLRDLKLYRIRALDSLAWIFQYPDHLAPERIGKRIALNGHAQAAHNCLRALIGIIRRGD